MMYDENDVRRFARNALAGMADSMAAMAEEDGELRPGDYTEQVREQALDFAIDMLGDFEAEVMREIREMKFKAELKMDVDFLK